MSPANKKWCSRLEELEKDVQARGILNVKLCNLVRQATVRLTQEDADIVREAYLLAGTTSPDPALEA